ncbi:MAG: HEAT repeat domain-containing protein [Candidatus Omnitrophica bacterium]|nr:hypothetical protein [bacterium]NUN96325.1 HEAT repeat domain-containing protein [Candidatus Omnitrophota bacterium]
MELSGNAPELPAKVIPCLLLALLGGCYLRQETPLETLVHDPARVERSASQSPSPERIEKLVSILDLRAKSGVRRVSDDQAARALEELSHWKRPSEGLELRCFPRIGSVAALLEDSSEDVRFHAAEACGRLGCREIEEDLERVHRGDKSLVVREAAAEALIRLGLTDEAWEE